MMGSKDTLEVSEKSSDSEIICGKKREVYKVFSEKENLFDSQELLKLVIISFILDFYI